MRMIKLDNNLGKQGEIRIQPYSQKTKADFQSVFLWLI